MDSKTKNTLIASAVVFGLIVGGLAIAANNNSNEKDSKTTNSTSTPATTPPPAKKVTVVDAASSNTSFSTLVAAVKAADLVTTLSDTSAKFTVFAPTNDAFAKLPAGTLDTLLKPENKSTLSGILTYHVVSGEVLASQLSNNQKVKTVNGAELTVKLEGGKAMLVDAKGGMSNITQTDLKTDNGVIHVIDTVVMPN